MRVKCGIYCFENTVTGMKYIGSSVNLEKRRKFHIWELRLGRHKNVKFQNAFNSYGEKVFRYSVLEYVDKNLYSDAEALRAALVFGREQYYLDTILGASENNDKFRLLGYNTCRRADSTKLGTKEKNPNPNKGKTGIYPKERIDKLIEAGKRTYKCKFCDKKVDLRNHLKHHDINCKKNPLLSEDSKLKKLLTYKKISDILANRPSPKLRKAIEQIDSISNIVIKEWDSGKYAAKSTGVNKGAICMVCKNKRPLAGGYKWRYKL